MKISLVLATVDRTSELERFLASLDRQSHRDFELIVVDQNPDDRLAPILGLYRGKFALSHLRSARGLSRARNAGLGVISGEIVGFPDDDCWYHERLLAQVHAIFDSRHEFAVVCGRIESPVATPYRGMPGRSAAINRYNLFRRSASAAMFLRREVVARVGPFDEAFGLGAATPWTGGEEQDYLIRALDAGVRAHYDAHLAVHHCAPSSIDQKALDREYVAARSFTRLLRKHNYPRWFVGYLISLSIGGALISLARGDRYRMRRYRRGLEAKLEGWRESARVGGPA